MVLAWNGADPSEVGDGSNYELGVWYRAEVDITITHLRIWTGPGEINVTNRRGRIWSSGGGALAVITLPDNPGDGWTLHALTAPLQIDSGTTFLPSYSTGGNYGALPNALNANVPSADGNLVALSAANSPTGFNGTFNTDPETFPNSGFGAPFYGVDFQYTLGHGDATPPRIVDTSAIADGLQVTAAAVVEDDEDLTGLTLRIDWGDGTDATTVTYPTLQASHTYATSGIYPLLFRATDSSGETANRADFVQVFGADASSNRLNTKAMQQALASHAMVLGNFKTVSLHEPRVRPAEPLHVALWWSTITPIDASGLAVTSARVEWLLRMYTPGEQEPQDEMDAIIGDATDRLIGSLARDFDLDDHVVDGLVRMIDIRGAHGARLNAVAGWARWSDGMSRVVTVTIPVIVNDVWQEGAA
ncbi:DUF4082 domain-containing protein [Lentzea cavernae]|uniref:PKD domain-containing protein n=1 Tax=Lentzea cavernae TaxID=2020703 RepID=A0ABQ3MSQ5_9PSEU|nr:DUF4082 domain-containing protein [Lentzea cavernae]GHH57726.1 hypothetical protein GCM10017774_77790 [Lentzea cavernae]